MRPSGTSTSCVSRAGAPPDLPGPREDFDEEVEEDEDEQALAEARFEQERQQKAAQAAAQSTAEDLTRNIQKKKERELAGLQFVGGDGASTATKTGGQGQEGRRSTIRARAGAARSTRSATVAGRSERIFAGVFFGTRSARFQRLNDWPNHENRFSLCITTLALATLAASGLQSAVLPGVIGPWKLVSSVPLDVQTKRALWNEYGLQDAEEGVYQKAGASMTV